MLAKEVADSRQDFVVYLVSIGHQQRRPVERCQPHPGTTRLGTRGLRLDRWARNDPACECCRTLVGERLTQARRPQLIDEQAPDQLKQTVVSRDQGRLIRHQERPEELTPTPQCERSPTARSCVAAVANDPPSQPVDLLGHRIRRCTSDRGAPNIEYRKRPAHRPRHERNHIRNVVRVKRRPDKARQLFGPRLPRLRGGCNL
jgi:hypothetical protein